MKKAILSHLLFLLLSTFCISNAFSLPAEDVQIVTDSQYFQTAQKMIRESKESIRVMMFEMGYYDEHPDTPSNLLVRELIEAKKRGVKVEIILDTAPARSAQFLAEDRVDAALVPVIALMLLYI